MNCKWKYKQNKYILIKLRVINFVKNLITYRITCDTQQFHNISIIWLIISHLQYQLWSVQYKIEVSRGFSRNHHSDQLIFDNQEPFFLIRFYFARLILQLAHSGKIKRIEYVVAVIDTSQIYIQTYSRIKKYSKWNE